MSATLNKEDKSFTKPRRFKKPTKTIKTKNDYIDKDDFYNELVLYRKARKEALEKGLPEPRPSDKIGEYIMLLVDRIIKSHRFNGYTDLWKDEMRSEGILSAVRSIKSFDTDKYDNPFAYFTTAVYYTFYGVIEKEKKNHRTSVMFNTEEHSDYTDIGADGFKYPIPQSIHDKLVNTTHSFYDTEDKEEKVKEERKRGKKKKEMETSESEE